MGYIPKPLDTSNVILPDGMAELTEALSKNVHEVWAACRMADGWKYGPVRDEAKKQHSCLVPYEDLSEEEKDFDRATALGTIKYILSKGFSIMKKEENQ